MTLTGSQALLLRGGGNMRCARITKHQYRSRVPRWRSAMRRRRRQWGDRAPCRAAFADVPRAPAHAKMGDGSAELARKHQIHGS
eukprot:8379861-Pyramimonas_sp.AAC.1